MRNKTLSAIVALSGLAAVAMPAGARVKKDETPLYKNASAPVEKRVDDLLSRMTLEEKIMQLNQYTLGRNTVENNLREMAGAVPAEAGSVIYFSDDANLRNMMQKRCMEETRLGIPMIFGHDVIHGYRTIAPVPLAQAASWNPDLVRTISRDAAKEAYYGGLDWTFSPMVDIAREKTRILRQCSARLRLRAIRAMICPRRAALPHALNISWDMAHPRQVATMFIRRFPTRHCGIPISLLSMPE